MKTLKWQLIKINYVFCLMLNLFLIFNLVSCDEKSLNHKSGIAPGNKNKDEDQTDNKTEPLNCDQQWLLYLKLNPKGRNFVYQETHSVMINKVPQILSQNISQYNILKNESDLVSWKKIVKLILPEKGESHADLSLEKSDFKNLCSKGVNFKLSDRPKGLSPQSKKDEVFTIEGIQYSVSNEIYRYKRESSGVVGLEQFEVWIGNKDPYEGVLFRSLRKYYGNETGVLLEHTIEKELENFESSNPG